MYNTQFAHFNNDILLVYAGAIKDKSFIKQFKSYEHLRAYARDAEDSGLWGKIKVSNKIYSSQSIKLHVVYDPLIVSTDF